MNRISELRAEKGISMKEAARLLNMPYTTYVNYEKGTREPNSETLIALANFYNTSVDYLIGKSSDRIDEKTLDTVNSIDQDILEYAGNIKDALTLQAMRENNKKPTIPPGFEPMPTMKKIPLIGSIACGEPITAEQNIEKMVDVPEYIRCDFSLTCHGDSMVDAGIHDKDVVYIRIQPEVENGEIAAVRIDGEATLKRVYYNPGTLTLMPANPAYAPMVYTGPQLEEVHIEGKAVGWTHWVG